MSIQEALLPIVATPLGPVGLIALLFAISLYANLSRRLGAVTKMPPRYRWFLIGGLFIGFALAVSILRGAAYLSPTQQVKFFIQPQFGLLFFHVPLLIGVALTVAIAWRYWSWLVTGEREQTQD